MKISRRDALLGAAGLGGASLLGVAPAMAQAKFFRIGTGGTGGTYYPIGGIIANAISTDKVNASAVIVSLTDNSISSVGEGSAN